MISPDDLVEPSVVVARTDGETSSHHFVAGCIAGFFARGFCQPFDVLKIRFQLQLDPIAAECTSAKYSGIAQGVKLIYREEGMKAFWKGHMPAQYLSVIYGGLQFYGYEYAMENLFQKRNEFAPNFLSGCIGGGVAMTVAHPIDVIRTRLVAQGEPKTYNGMTDAMRLMYSSGGMRTFYKGLSSNLIQVIPNNGFCFGFYHFFHPILEKVPFVPASFVSGALAGLCSKTIVYPFDLVKKRLQVQGFADRTHQFGRYDGLLGCISTVFRSEGFMGFFKGYIPSGMKAMAMSACQFTFYEIAMFLYR